MSKLKLSTEERKDYDRLVDLFKTLRATPDLNVYDDAITLLNRGWANQGETHSCTAVAQALKARMRYLAGACTAEAWFATHNMRKELIELYMNQYSRSCIVNVRRPQWWNSTNTRFHAKRVEAITNFINLCKDAAK